MSHLVNQAKRFSRSQDGAVAVEYALMLALIVCACLITLSRLGQSTNRMFQRIYNVLESGRV